MKKIILGAGFTGLAAGINTGATIYEASSHAGGICRSYVKEGFHFDNGGTHWIFGNSETVEWIRKLTPLNTYDRRAGVYYNKMFPYPIQTYSETVQPRTPGYFKDWLGKKFSNDMCQMFFYPFNEKYTAGLFDEIIQFDSYKTPPAGSKGYVSQFHDPVDGLSSLVDKMAAQCKIEYNKKAIFINYADKIVMFQDGDSVKYDQLITTMPLTQTLTMCGQKSFDLPYSSVLVLNIGAKPGVNLPNEHWVYIPFSKCGFYRVGFYTNADPKKAPEGMVGLCVEMAFHGYEYSDIDTDFAIDQVVDELQRWGWIDEVIVADPTWVHHAYTWNRTPEEREKWLNWLKERDILSIGRYGGWKFQGLVESIQQGLDL